MFLVFFSFTGIINPMVQENKIKSLVGNFSDFQFLANLDHKLYRCTDNSYNNLFHYLSSGWHALFTWLVPVYLVIVEQSASAGWFGTVR